MRELTNHIVSGDQAVQLKVTVEDEPGAGGACHSYGVYGPDNFCFAAVYFQNGAIKEHGVNGITHEALLAILIDRLAAFQNGPFPSDENLEALRCLKQALHHLQDRTLKRIARGVEGQTKE